MASFVSSKELKIKRDEKKQAWKTILAEEEKKYIVKQKHKEKMRERGKDSWILPSVEKRLKQEHKLKKSHKHKKHKKPKKHKKVSSSSEADSENEWTEKTSNDAINQEYHGFGLYNKTGLQGSSKKFESMNFDFIDKTSSCRGEGTRKQKREFERQQQEKKQAEILARRELNPSRENNSNCNDQKPSIDKKWLLSSLRRMKESAKTSGKSLQEIAGDYYGSWEKFQALLDENGNSLQGKNNKGNDNKTKANKNLFLKPSEEDDKNHYHNKVKSVKRKYNEPSWKKQSFKDNKNSGISENLISKKGGKLEKNDKVTFQLNMQNNDKCNETQIKKHSFTAIIEKQDSIEEKNIIEKQSKAVSKPLIKNVKILTEKEKNQLAAKILKADLLGNTKLSTKLKEKLNACREAEKLEAGTNLDISKTNVDKKDNSDSSESSDDNTVVLSRTGKNGQEWPVRNSDKSFDSLPSKRRKKKKVPTHGDDNKRDRYFADDDRFSLKELVEREKTETAEDQDAMFSRLASKQFSTTNADDFTLDDMYVSQAAKNYTQTEHEIKLKQRAIASHRKLVQKLDKCKLCFGSPTLSKHLIVAIGKKVMLILPHYKPLVEGHCLITPMHHSNNGLILDEDIWEEIKLFMKALARMFESKHMDCVFMQTCINLNKSNHFYIDCIPLDKEIGDMAPIYFKKAIQESESEWSQNKKLIDTRSKDLRQCIPKGLPYFAVEFGTNGGFAHVVEDETVFPHFFGREIVGGMLDVEPKLWRNPPQDHFTEQTKRSLNFSEWWKKFDFTQDL